MKTIEEFTEMLRRRDLTLSLTVAAKHDDWTQIHEQRDAIIAAYREAYSAITP